MLTNFFIQHFLLCFAQDQVNSLKLLHKINLNYSNVQDIRPLLIFHSLLLCFASLHVLGYKVRHLPESPSMQEPPQAGSTISLLLEKRFFWVFFTGWVPKNGDYASRGGGGVVGCISGRRGEVKEMQKCRNGRGGGWGVLKKIRRG
jgi:hypothetical protein